jgi:hypothetical protein
MKMQLPLHMEMQFPLGMKMKIEAKVLEIVGEGAQHFPFPTNIPSTTNPLLRTRVF